MQHENREIVYVLDDFRCSEVCPVCHLGGGSIPPWKLQIAGEVFIVRACLHPQQLCALNRCSSTEGAGFVLLVPLLSSQVQYHQVVSDPFRPDSRMSSVRCNSKTVVYRSNSFLQIKAGLLSGNPLSTIPVDIMFQVYVQCGFVRYGLRCPAQNAFEIVQLQKCI